MASPSLLRPSQAIECRSIAVGFPAARIFSLAMACFPHKTLALHTKAKTVLPNPSLNLSRYGMPRLAASASRWHFAYAARRVMPPLSG
jgi:hypothetical protein